VPANVAQFAVDIAVVVAANNVLHNANAELTRRLAVLEQDNMELVKIMRQSPQLLQEAEACHVAMVATAVAANNALHNDNTELVQKVAALEEYKKRLMRSVQQFPGQLEQVAAGDFAMTDEQAAGSAQQSARVDAMPAASCKKRSRLVVSAALTELCRFCKVPIASEQGLRVGVISSCCQVQCSSCWVLKHLPNLPSSLECTVCGKYPDGIVLFDAAGVEHAVPLRPLPEVFLPGKVRR
jgi:hypothetical protein